MERKHIVIASEKARQLDRANHKIVIVSQKTRLQELIERFNTKEQAQFYIEHLGGSFQDYVDEERCYAAALALVRQMAEKYARVSVIDKSFLCHYIFGAEDIVICVGRDGLVCNTMKYLTERNLVIGVNPDPSRWDGVVLPFKPADMFWLLPLVCQAKEEVPFKRITFAHAVTQNGQELYAANDLFVGAATHISARYDIAYKERAESQSSSGVIISTGLGQSGWYKSVLAQVKACTGLLQMKKREIPTINWGDQVLSFVVREPYPSVSSGADIVMGKIKSGECPKLRSNMPEKGVIFSDGIEEDAIAFNAGTEVTITVAKKWGNLVMCG